MDSISVVKNGSPSLIFIFTDKTKPLSKAGEKSKLTPEPTVQAKASEEAWIELFQTEGDYSVFIPGRFFNVVRMDATKIDESQNKYLSSEKAPMAIITTKSGEIAAVFDGKAKIKTSIIVAAMIDVLKKDGCVKGLAPFSELNALMVSLEKSELAAIYAEEALKTAKDKLSKEEAKEKERLSKSKKKSGKEEGPAQNIVMAQKNADAAEAAFKAKQKEKDEVLKKEYAMLKKLDLPSSKMPKEPAGAQY